MKRILILTDGFAAPAYVPRIRFLIHHLQAKGYDVEVLTEWICEDKQMPDIGCMLHQMHYYRLSGSMRQVEWGYKFLLNMLYPHKEYRLLAMGQKICRAKKFDLIFCSCFHTFPLITAAKLAEQFNLPLIADLRDIEEQCPGTGYLAHHAPQFFGLDRLITKSFRRVNLKRRNSVLQQADAVTTVSEWHVRTLQQYNKRVELIYNGYDASVFIPNNVTTAHFNICYTGRLYEPIMQDPTLFFEAMANLIHSGKVDPKEVQIQFYTNETSKEKLQKYSTRYGLDSLIAYLPYVPTEQVPALLQESSLLLVFSNKASEQGANGIMTTKLYEALGVEKPVLCVRSDESLLADLIAKTGCGIAATSVDQAEQYILQQYDIWKKQGYTRLHTQPEKYTRYSRQEQSDKLCMLMEEVMKQPIQK